MEQTSQTFRLSSPHLMQHRPLSLCCEICISKGWCACGPMVTVVPTSLHKKIRFHNVGLRNVKPPHVHNSFETLTLTAPPISPWSHQSVIIRNIMTEEIGLFYNKPTNWVTPLSLYRLSTSKRGSEADYDDWGRTSLERGVAKGPHQCH